jgi:hypothetical protein
MVIINYKGGQLANRIYAFGHFIANSMEHGYSLYNPEFDEYVPYFEATSKNYFEGHPISVTLFKNYAADRVFSRVFRLWADVTHKLFARTSFYILYRLFKTNDKKNINFNLNDAGFVNEAQHKRVITQGWTFRDHANFIKHAAAIRRFFAPVEKYRLMVNELMTATRKEADVIIGVHIRRGDYIRYNGGTWYYPDEVYAEKMLQVQQQMSALGKTCAFLICSNDDIDTGNFPSQLKMITGKRHFMVDLYGLAQCDGIIGPPSTFSQWASFYGQVPLCFIFTKEDTIQLGEYVHACNP